MEGPSIHILAEELQLMVNNKIIDSFGNASFDKSRLINQTIHQIYGVGKRLIIQLNDVALVTHFLMYGSYRINESRASMAPRLALISENNSFYIYNCSVKIIETSNLKSTLDLTLDILSPEWNIKKIINLIKQKKGNTIDDVLLDQEIFAGVGNIIKNEVLFLSKISPLCLISQLSSKKLKEIVQHARDFSKKFYELKKIFELKKNLQVYRKKICPCCGGVIIRRKTGLRQRWSFFCPHCQNLCN